MRDAGECCNFPATIKWRAENDLDSYLACTLAPEKEAAIRCFKTDGHLGVSKHVSQMHIAGRTEEG